MCDKNSEEFHVFALRVNLKLLRIKTDKNEIAAVYNCNHKQIKTLINLFTGNVSCNAPKNG